MGKPYVLLNAGRHADFGVGEREQAKVTVAGQLLFLRRLHIQVAHKHHDQRKDARDQSQVTHGSEEIEEADAEPPVRPVNSLSEVFLSLRLTAIVTYRLGRSVFACDFNSVLGNIIVENFFFVMKTNLAWEGGPFESRLRLAPAKALS